MQGHRKVFRVEAMNAKPARAARPAPVANGDLHQSQHHEIMAELRALRSIIEPQEQVTQRVIDEYRKEIVEAQKLKGELDLIYDAINRTKTEIATLHVTGFEGPEMARVTHELDAIVDGTERATEQ